MKDHFVKMDIEQAQLFQHDVLSIVKAIPSGRVTTYGYIATLAGYPSHARMVGRILRYAPEAISLPCHRVVNVVGRTAPGWGQQRILLEGEGIMFKPNGHVDMKQFLWNPESMIDKEL